MLYNIKQLDELGIFPLKQASLRNYLERPLFAKYRVGRKYELSEEFIGTWNRFWVGLCKRRKVYFAPVKLSRLED